MKSPLFLITTLCSALLVGGTIFVALVLLRLRGRVVEPEYIVLPPSLPVTDAEQQRERELQSI
jgi:hypothetical protein